MTTHYPIDASRSPLGGYASKAEKVGESLAFDDPQHLAAHRWIVEETYILDEQRYHDWLAILADDIHYYMPVKVTTALGAGYDTAPGMAHFDENMYSLSRRVARFETEHAWTEDPPSRLRHFVTNVRTFATDKDDEIIVESATLLFRSHGDINEPAIVSAGRRDLLRKDGEGWLLARRHLAVDESVLRTQNLAIFL